MWHRNEIGDVKPKTNIDPVLIKLLARADAILHQLTNTDSLSISNIAENEKLTPSYIARLIRLATLSPTIKERILSGNQPDDLTVTKLNRLPNLPITWAEQESLLGIF